ncbi:unnamed protein product [Linum trigynum]|uniref:Uncharacterized protein n=1 Tax=Linum trigynum TaxID=586398 RepID=A0AAV2EE03_9ROSI
MIAKGRHAPHRDCLPVMIRYGQAATAAYLAPYATVRVAVGTDLSRPLNIYEWKSGGRLVKFALFVWGGGNWEFGTVGW